MLLNKKLRHKELIVLAYLVTSVLVSQACKSSNDPGSDDAMRIRQVVSTFFEEAYGPNGNVEEAYSLFAKSAQATCPAVRFTNLAMLAREAVGHRKVTIDQFRSIRISGDVAQVEMVIAMGDQVAQVFPQEARLQSENNDWRITITTDPTCSSMIDFFDLRNANDR